MTDPVIIAGAGIGGLALGLTLQQLKVPFVIHEAVTDLAPLGLGINLQPNAVRELYDLGIGEKALDGVGIQTREWALLGMNGQDLYSEPRGLTAGYRWPQYSVHRGRLQMLLYDTLLERAGESAVVFGSRVLGYRNAGDGVAVTVADANGARCEIRGRPLVGVDGLHSCVRARMYPQQPPVHWGGAVMWRGLSRARPARTGASFVGVGRHDQRLVFYPLGPPDPDTGVADINWIAEITVERSDDLQPGDWNQQVDPDTVLAPFRDWNYDWLDVPALIAGAERIYAYPMTDREPVPSWQDGNVALMGDAAHVMYPVGSNGASQAIVDARVLGAQLLAHGVNAAALAAYDAQLCGPISELVLRNRGSGPFGLLELIDERCAGDVSRIDEVMPQAERDAFMASYKRAAGFDRDRLNAAPPTIDPATLT